MLRLLVVTMNTAPSKLRSWLRKAVNEGRAVKVLQVVLRVVALGVRVGVEGRATHRACFLPLRDALGVVDVAAMERRLAFGQLTMAHGAWVRPL